MAFRNVWEDYRDEERIEDGLRDPRDRRFREDVERGTVRGIYETYPENSASKRKGYERTERRGHHRSRSCERRSNNENNDDTRGSSGYGSCSGDYYDRGHDGCERVASSSRWNSDRDGYLKKINDREKRDDKPVKHTRKFQERSETRDYDRSTVWEQERPRRRDYDRSRSRERDRAGRREKTEGVRSDDSSEDERRDRHRHGHGKRRSREREHDRRSRRADRDREDDKEYRDHGQRRRSVPWVPPPLHRDISGTVPWVPPPIPVPPPVKNQFQNDGSFMELFRQQMEAAKMQGQSAATNADSAAATVTTSTVTENTDAAFSTLPAATIASGPPVIAKRRPAKLLKTGMVLKPKKEEGAEVEDKGDPWSRYMQEVNKYRANRCIEEDFKTRPLMKSIQSSKRIGIVMNVLTGDRMKTGYGTSLVRWITLCEPNPAGKFLYMDDHLEFCLTACARQ